MTAHEVEREAGSPEDGGRNGSKRREHEGRDPIVVLVEPIAPGLASEAAAGRRPTLFQEDAEVADASGLAHGRPASLADVLAPMRVETFLQTIKGASFARFKGDGSRLASLLPWDAFNALLRHSRLDANRIRLMHESVRLPASAFLEEVPQMAPLGKPLRINTVAVEDYLRRGASLVLHAVDELVDEVGHLTRSFERNLGSLVSVNAWVKYGASEGIGAHWDDHDTYILQLHGEKHWTVYRPSFSFPMPEDFGRPPLPTDEPVFDGTVEPGDVLYMPRGWWHSVSGLGNPTMHLTFGTRPATGISLMALVRRRLHEHEVARRDLPRFATPEEQRQYAASVRSALLEVFDDDIVTSYLLDSDVRVKAAPHPSLPWAATSDDLPPDVMVRLCTPRRLTVHAGRESGQAEFSACGERWVVDAVAVPLLRALADRRPITVGALTAMSPGVAPAAAGKFIRTLLDHGVIEALGPGRATGVGAGSAVVTSVATGLY